MSDTTASKTPKGSRPVADDQDATVGTAPAGAAEPKKSPKAPHPAETKPKT